MEIHVWYRNTDAGLTKLNTARNAVAELPFSGVLIFRHFPKIYQYHKEFLAPWVRRSGIYLRFVNFMKVQVYYRTRDMSLCTTRSMDMKDISFFTTNSMDVLGCISLFRAGIQMDMGRYFVCLWRRHNCN